MIVPMLASQLTELYTKRAIVFSQVEALVDAHPLSAVLTSMPGIAVKTAARLLTEVVGKEFSTAGRLASYAGIAPTTRRSGTSIRGECANRGGHKRLKSALFNSAFASLRQPPSRRYYDKKPAEKKTHKQAVIGLPRRRLDTLYEMLRMRCFTPARSTKIQQPQYMATISQKLLDKNLRRPLQLAYVIVITTDREPNE